MSNSSERLPHIELRLVREGIAASPTGQRKQSERTNANRGDAGGHGRRLKSSVASIIADWQQTVEERKEEGKPDLPEAVPFVLQVDPNSFDADILKSFGIEVIAELEDGYIIGASADLEFTELQKKIEKCISGERGGGRVPEIWELIEGKLKRPEYILSEQLLATWDQVKDGQIYTVDVGIACVGLNPKFSKYPEQNEDEDPETYAPRLARWMDKRGQTQQEWDDLQWQREQEFTKFVEGYRGEIIHSASWKDSVARLPDSFSCRIQILGKGLKDLVFNFPYVFDVNEPDEFSEQLRAQDLTGADEEAFELEPPAINAPRICVIDSGIQEQHSLLRAAIDGDNSRSWVPGETDKTADYVPNGGHGTRVAGAVLYPQCIPRSGKQQAICWIQNARILDKNCCLPKRLFPPETLEEIVSFYYRRAGTRIFNQSITGSTPCRTQYMSAWAASIDKLTWENDILFIVPTGNLPLDGAVGISRPSIADHFRVGRPYPHYLLEPSCRVANPAQSFQALTVGSIASCLYHAPPFTSVALQEHPSAFTCSGLGIWETIKPEVVEYGGDLVKDEGTPPSLTHPSKVCPELIRATLGGGPLIASDNVGTSFAAPKVTHIAAALFV